MLELVSFFSFGAEALLWAADLYGFSNFVANINPYMSGTGPIYLYSAAHKCAFLLLGSFSSSEGSFMPKLIRPNPVLTSLLIGSLISLVGCASALALGGSENNSKERALPANLIRIPMTRQATDYTCGVAALQSVLGYFGDEFREGALSKRLKCDPQEGTDYQQMVSFAKSKGYKVDVRKNMKIADLKKLIDQKKPTICLIQAWPERKVNYETDWQDGHYVVAIGYDSESIYFMDPSTLGNYTFIPTQEFLKRWHDTDSKVKLFNFGMVIEKPKTNYDQNVAKKME